MSEVSVLASSAGLGIFAVEGTNILHRSANGWLTLAPIPGMGGTASAGITALSIDASGLIYAAFANYSAPDSNAVYYSADTGATWHLAGLTGFATNALVSASDTTYALTYGNWGYVFTSQVNTGIATVSPKVNNIRAYPNPSASGVWNIQTGEEWIGSSADIYDVSGRIVYSSTIKNVSTQISATNLPTGVYVLRISNAVNTVNVWLVK